MPIHPIAKVANSPDREDPFDFGTPGTAPARIDTGLETLRKGVFQELLKALQERNEPQPDPRKLSKGERLNLAFSGAFGTPDRREVIQRMVEERTEGAAHQRKVEFQDQNIKRLSALIGVVDAEEGRIRQAEELQRLAIVAQLEDYQSRVQLATSIQNFQMDRKRFQTETIDAVADENSRKKFAKSSRLNFPNIEESTKILTDEIEASNNPTLLSVGESIKALQFGLREKVRNLGVNPTKFDIEEYQRTKDALAALKANTVGQLLGQKTDAGGWETLPANNRENFTYTVAGEVLVNQAMEFITNNPEVLSRIARRTPLTLLEIVGQSELADKVALLGGMLANMNSTFTKERAGTALSPTEFRLVRGMLALIKDSPKQIEFGLLTMLNVFITKRSSLQQAHGIGDEKVTEIQEFIRERQPFMGSADALMRGKIVGDEEPDGPTPDGYTETGMEID